jgi:hypothetical protein
MLFDFRVPHPLPTEWPLSLPSGISRGLWLLSTDRLRRDSNDERVRDETVEFVSSSPLFTRITLLWTEAVERGREWRELMTKVGLL